MKSRKSVDPPPEELPVAGYVSVDGRPEVFSEGHRLLLCVPDSLVKIAQRLGVTKQIVSQWRQGRRPGISARYRLQTGFGIPADSWSQEPVSQAPASASRVGPRPARPPPVRAVSKAAGKAPSTPPTAAVPDGAPSAPSSTLDGVEVLLRTIREHRNKPGLLPQEQVKLADAETRLLSLRHRLERETEMTEDRVVRGHPMWARIKGTLATTLVRWPDAARAVIAALRELEEP